MVRNFTIAALMLAACSVCAYAESFDGAISFTYASGPQDDWMGCFQKARYNAAVKLEADQFPGYKVVGIEATDLNHCTGMGNYTGWVSTRLSADNEDFVPDIEVLDIPAGPVDGKMSVKFSKPVEIPAEGLYVGYGLEVLEENDDNIVPIPMCMGTAAPGSAWVHVSIDGWQGWADYSEMPGCAICMTVYLEGEVADNFLAVESVNGHTTFLKREPFTLQFAVANGGGNAIESLTYKYKIGDQSFEKELQLAKPIAPVLGSLENIELSFDAVTKQGVYDFELWVPKVNGVDNVSTNNRVKSRVSFVEYAPKHIPLMEEATGTWCGNCPRGWLGMRELGKQLGEDFIGIAYHNNDPMQVTEAYPWKVSGYPDAVLDRGKSIDPFYGAGFDTEFGIMGCWQETASQTTVAEISATAAWGDDSKEFMDVNTTVKFALDNPAADYKVGYVLVGNRYCHPDMPTWIQHNYFAGVQYDGMLAELSAMPEYITDMVYNHVALDTSASMGVAKSLPYRVELGESYSHSYWFATKEIYGMFQDNLVENPDNLEVVAFLMDGSGKVLNSCKAKPAGSSAVKTVETESAKAEYYDLTGRKVINPTHGIYIMRRGGITRKVMF